MPAPTAYSDAGLANLMIVEIGGVAGVLGWTTASAAVAEAVADAALLLEADIVDVTDMAALRAVARLCIWRAVEGALSSIWDVTVDVETLRRSQMRDAAAKMVARYEGQCATLGISIGNAGRVTIYPVIRSEDPYAISGSTGTEF